MQPKLGFRLAVAVSVLLPFVTIPQAQAIGGGAAGAAAFQAFHNSSSSNHYNNSTGSSEEQKNPDGKSPTIRAGNSIPSSLVASTRLRHSEENPQSTVHRLRQNFIFVGSAPSSNDSDALNTWKGYLEPKFSHVVFNPVYFWLPFKTWSSSNSGYYGNEHMDSEDNSTNSSPDVSTSPSENRSVNELVQSFSRSDTESDLYKAGHVGSSEVDQLPEWIQASLRLMSTKQQSLRPSDPIIHPLNETVGDLNTKSAPLFAKITDLTSQINNTGEFVNLAHQNMQILQDIKDKQAEMPLAQIQRENDYKQLVQAHALVKAADQDIATVKSKSAICKLTSWASDKACDMIVKDNIKTRNELQDNYQALVEKDKDNQELLERYRSYISVKNDQIKGNEDRLKLANMLTPQDRQQALAHQDDLQKQRAALIRKASALSGFVTWDRSHTILFAQTSKQCQGPMYSYHIVGEAAAHPLFKDAVEAELLPTDDAELVVCLNATSHITSVHIIHDREEKYSSTIVRNAEGQIEELRIAGDRDTPLEQHTWVNLPNGQIAYGQKFVDAYTVRAIRTEFRPD